MNLKVQEVSKKDLSILYALEKNVFKRNAFSKNLLKKLMKYNLLFVKLIEKKIIVKILGFAIIVEDNKERANLANFLVHPKYQSKGYGKYMLEKTIKMFKQNYPQYNKIFLNVQTTNNKAINLYQKFNFRIKKEIPRYYYSGEDSYLMELII